MIPFPDRAAAWKLTPTILRGGRERDAVDPEVGAGAKGPGRTSRWAGFRGDGRPGRRVLQEADDDPPAHPAGDGVRGLRARPLRIAAVRRLIRGAARAPWRT